MIGALKRVTEFARLVLNPGHAVLALYPLQRYDVEHYRV
jgi:hypothetical protein